MSESLKLNASQVEQNAAGISGAVNGFEMKTLEPIDSESTISANEKGKNTYKTSQSDIAAFSASLSQDAENIRSLNISFQEFDVLMARLTIQRMVPALVGIGGARE